MKDAIISNSFTMVLQHTLHNSRELFTLLYMDSRLFLMETASSSPVSLGATFPFILHFLSFWHCLLGVARLTLASKISLSLEAMLLS